MKKTVKHDGLTLSLEDLSDSVPTMCYKAVLTHATGMTDLAYASTQYVVLQLVFLKAREQGHSITSDTEKAMTTRITKGI